MYCRCYTREILCTARSHSRRALRWAIQAIINFLAASILFSTARWAIPPLGNDLVFYGADSYHNASEVVERQRHLPLPDLNHQRLARANQMLVEGDLRRFSRPNNRLAIGIVASARPNQPLTQLMGHLSAYLASNYSLLICNTEPNPLPYFKELRRFEPFIPIADLRPPGTDPPPSHPFPTPDERLRKEADDYWRCLNSTGRRWNGVEYVLLLEDDALPIPEFTPTLHSVMQQMDRLVEVDYVKLYHPWPWRGAPSAFHAAAMALSIDFNCNCCFNEASRKSIPRIG